MASSKVMLAASVVAISISLAGCGGGGGAQSSAPPVPSSTTPTPAPVPTPAPAPAPTPTPPPTSIAPETIGLTQMASFPTLGWVYRFTANSDGRIQGTAAPPTSDRIEFGFNAGTRRHEILIPGLERSTLDVAFGDRDYTGSILRPANRVILYRPVPENQTIALAHTSFGFWDRDGALPAGVSEQNRGLFAYGVPTPAQEMPAGITRYRAVALVFTEIEDARSVPLLAGAGTLEFNNDGSIVSVSGEIGPMRLPLDDIQSPFLLADGPRIAAYSLTLRSYVAGGLFTGVLSTPDATGPSLFEGFFTGPGAAELLLRFQAPYRDLVTGRTGTLSGVLVAKKI